MVQYISECIIALCVVRPGEWIADIYQESVLMSPHSLAINVLNYISREAVSSSGVVVCISLYYICL